MHSDDLSKTDPDNWIAIHFFVDDPRFLIDVKKIMDKEIVAISDKLNGWFFAFYTEKNDPKLLTPYRYKLILWKKSETDNDEIIQFFGGIASTKLRSLLHQHPDNPWNEVRYGGADTYGGINDLYLSCFATRIRLQMLDEFKLEFDENQMAFTLHMMFNQISKTGYLYDHLVASKLLFNALAGMKIDPVIRKDN